MAEKIDAASFFAPQFVQAKKSSVETWSQLKNSRIFLTGGTGFFGKWLLEMVAWANESQGSQIQIYLLTRDPENFKKEYARLASATWLTLIKGDVTTFEFPNIDITHIIHAATPASVKMNQEQPELMLNTITQGTERVLEFAKKMNVRRFLFTSSGGVYGAQPSNMTHLLEDYAGAPSSLRSDSAYGEGKRVAELQCTMAYQNYGIETIIARCFAFAGPYLPLDSHFAVGNFIRDALSGEVIQINGDGTPCRSYLYGADLAQWLFTLLAFGQPVRNYHVGSENFFSIREIAEAVAHIVGRIEKRKIDIRIAQTPVVGQPPARYVPSTQRAQTEFGLKQNFDLEEAVELTVRWYKN